MKVERCPAGLAASQGDGPTGQAVASVANRRVSVTPARREPSAATGMLVDVKTAMARRGSSDRSPVQRRMTA